MKSFDPNCVFEDDDADLCTSLGYGISLPPFGLASALLGEGRGMTKNRIHTTSRRSFDCCDIHNMRYDPFFERDEDGTSAGCERCETSNDTTVSGRNSQSVCREVSDGNQELVPARLSIRL